jgi:hypothetical protein
LTKDEVDGTVFGENGFMKPPVFIVGCPRSGTSFLYHLLLSSGGFAEFRTQMNVFDVLEPIFGDLSLAKNKKKMLREWLASKAFAASGVLQVFPPERRWPVPLGLNHRFGDPAGNWFVSFKLFSKSLHLIF